jgi:glyoxylase-like metal-dependent hydrolase (beta-lactamase superfamily II)
MNLEDHLGDIIRKARGMSNVTPAAAAAAAGISEADLDALEKTGVTATKPNYAALAPLIGLSAPKLQGIVNGWLPSEKDLGLWHELRVFTTFDDGMGVHCYLAWDEVSKEAALFDTGMDEKPVLECIAAEKLNLKHIFITHSHYDHIEKLGAVRAAHPKARVHSNTAGTPVEHRNKPSEIIHLGGLRVTHRDTPGHSEDGVTYIVGNWQEDAPLVVIVGDAIFAGSMGKGMYSWEIARQKVREQILTLPADALICPGHGPLTTVAEEKANNPFFP